MIDFRQSEPIDCDFLAALVQSSNNAIQRRNPSKAYRILYSGYWYPPVEQLGPGVLVKIVPKTQNETRKKNWYHGFTPATSPTTLKNFNIRVEQASSCHGAVVR